MKALLDLNSDIAARPIDAVSRVRLMLEGYVRLGLEHPNAYRLVFCVTQREAPTERQSATAEIGSECYARYIGVVREIAASGRLRTGDADSAAQALWTACHGLVALMITRPNLDWAPPKTLGQGDARRAAVRLGGGLNLLTVGGGGPRSGGGGTRREARTSPDIPSRDDPKVPRPVPASPSTAKGGPPPPAGEEKFLPRLIELPARSA